MGERKLKLLIYLQRLYLNLEKTMNENRETLIGYFPFKVLFEFIKTTKIK
jgi:hypothetical protein